MPCPVPTSPRSTGRFNYVLYEPGDGSQQNVGADERKLAENSPEKNVGSSMTGASSRARVLAQQREIQASGVIPSCCIVRIGGSTYGVWLVAIKWSRVRNSDKRILRVFFILLHHFGGGGLIREFFSSYFVYHTASSAKGQFESAVVEQKARCACSLCGHRQTRALWLLGRVRVLSDQYQRKRRQQALSSGGIRASDAASLSRGLVSGTRVVRRGFRSLA